MQPSCIFCRPVADSSEWERCLQALLPGDTRNMTTVPRRPQTALEWPPSPSQMDLSLHPVCHLIPFPYTAKLNTPLCPPKPRPRCCKHKGADMPVCCPAPITAPSAILHCTDNTFNGTSFTALTFPTVSYF